MREGVSQVGSAVLLGAVCSVERVVVSGGLGFWQEVAGRVYGHACSSALVREHRHLGVPSCAHTQARPGRCACGCLHAFADLSVVCTHMCEARPFRDTNTLAMHICMGKPENRNIRQAHPVHDHSQTCAWACMHARMLTPMQPHAGTSDDMGHLEGQSLGPESQGGEPGILMRHYEAALMDAQVGNGMCCLQPLCRMCCGPSFHGACCSLVFFYCACPQPAIGGM